MQKIRGYIQGCRLTLFKLHKKTCLKIFLTTSGLVDAKYSLINGILYQVIGVMNLSEIKKWNKIKKSSRWAKVNFHSQTDKSQTKHFSYNSK